MLLNVEFREPYIIWPIKWYTWNTIRRICRYEFWEKIEFSFCV